MPAPVNWELRSGDEVERFTAALILLSNPAGNRITPAGGDRGVDILVDTPEGADIYQVKRYTRPLQTTEKRSVERSWNRFVEQVLPTRRIRSWTLVVPLDPTHQAREWLTALGRDHPDVPIHWVGRSHLDVLSANNPRIVEYYFYAGEQRTYDLMAQVLSGAAEIPTETTGDELLAAIASRQDRLVEALNEVDPFYRCEREVRYGRVTELDADSVESRGAIWMKFEQITPDRYSIVRWTPLSAESTWLRPISLSVLLQAEQGSPRLEELRRFMLYGAPLTDFTGQISASTGPAGGQIPNGSASFTIWSRPTPTESHSGLEFRITNPAGEVLAVVDLDNIEISSGVIQEPGHRLAGSDKTGYLTVEIFMGIPDEPQQLTLIRKDVGGKVPRDLLPAAQLCAHIAPGNQGCIAIRDGGPELTAAWPFENSESVRAILADGEELVQLCQDLRDIQKHTYSAVRFPYEPPDHWFARIHQYAELIRGDIASIDFPTRPVKFTMNNSTEFEEDQTYQVVIDDVLHVDMVSEIVETSVPIRLVIDEARVVRHGEDRLGAQFVPVGSDHTMRLSQVDSDDWERGRTLVRDLDAEA